MPIAFWFFETVRHCVSLLQLPFLSHITCGRFYGQLSPLIRFRSQSLNLFDPFFLRDYLPRAHDAFDFPLFELGRLNSSPPPMIGFLVEGLGLEQVDRRPIHYLCPPCLFFAPLLEFGPGDSLSL